MLFLVHPKSHLKKTQNPIQFFFKKRKRVLLFIGAAPISQMSSYQTHLRASTLQIHEIGLGFPMPCVYGEGFRCLRVSLFLCLLIIPWCSGSWWDGCSFLWGSWDVLVWILCGGNSCSACVWQNVYMSLKLLSGWTSDGSFLWCYVIVFSSYLLLSLLLVFGPELHFWSFALYAPSTENLLLAWLKKEKPFFPCN